MEASFRLSPQPPASVPILMMMVNRGEEASSRQIGIGKMGACAVHLGNAMHSGHDEMK
jgi:hypothetical protein